MKRSYLKRKKGLNKASPRQMYLGHKSHGPKRSPLKRRSDKGKIIDSILAILREQRKKETDSKCEVCRRPFRNLGLHHVLERSRCPRLIVSRNNLLLMCWGCHHALHHYTKNNPRYIRVENRIVQLRGKEYEIDLLTEDKMQCKMTLTYLTTYLLALEQERKNAV